MDKIKYVVFVDKDRTNGLYIRAVSRDLNFILDTEKIEIEVDEPKDISKAVKEKLGYSD